MTDTLNRITPKELDNYTRLSRTDQWHQELVGSDVRRLIEEVRYWKDQAFRPLGDNHHNAKLCPHCNQGSEISVHPALAAAAEILANFKTEGNKLEEWQACYAKLFTQMNDICNQKRELFICTVCGGNDADTPCAYPGYPNKACLRTKRLSEIEGRKP